MSTTVQTRPGHTRLRTLWAHSWRMLLAFFAGFIAFVFVYEPFLDGGTSALPGASDERLFLDLVVGLLALGLYPLRHRFPIPIVGIILLLSTFSVFSSVTTSLALISLATRRRPLEIATFFILAICSGMASELYFPLGEPLVWWQNIIVLVVVFALTMVIGMYIGGRRELMESLVEQAQSAHREEQARLQGARAAERTRIAREMHDVLAHRLSLVALHAGALEYRTDLSPEETGKAAAVIRENAHLALGELRDVLGVLRDPNTLFEDEHDRPQPTLAELPGLLEQSRSVGTPVELEMKSGLESTLALLPETTGRHVYRVIQEALTNARRHAPGEAATVVLSGQPGKQIRLHISNPLASNNLQFSQAETMPSSGLGLVGLGERLRLAGGNLTVDNSSNSTFVMEAWLPWEK